jgi:hypothetical protein
MAWDTGAPVSADPTGYICDRIKNNLGIGSAPLRNWSFVENIAEGTVTVEKQRLTLTNFGAGDTFRITFNGHETADIAFNATGTTLSNNILAALNALADFTGANNNPDVSYISGQNSSPTIFDIFSSAASKWHGVAFSVTNAVGCSGAIAQTVAPVMRTGSASYSMDVFKCAGSGDDANDGGCDFYVLLTRDKTVTATSFQVTIAMEWSTVYHKARYLIDRLTGSTISPPTVDANGWSGGSTVPGSYYYPAYILNTSFHTYWSWVLNKSGFTYQLKMTKNFLVISTRVSTTDNVIHLGVFDSLVQGATDTYPACVVCNVHTGNAYSAFMNLPGLGAISPGVASAFELDIVGWTAPANIGVTNANNAFDKWANSGIWVARVCLVHSVSAAQRYLWGGARGLLKSDILCFYNGGTVNIGDTMTIGGTTYTVLGPVHNSGNPTMYLVTQAN